MILMPSWWPTNHLSFCFVSGDIQNFKHVQSEWSAVKCLRHQPFVNLSVKICQSMLVVQWKDERNWLADRLIHLRHQFFSLVGHLFLLVGMIGCPVELALLLDYLNHLPTVSLLSISTMSYI